MNKINKIRTWAIAIALLCACWAGKSTAQPTLDLPINPDYPWYHSAGSSNPIIGLNTALISFGNYTNAYGLAASVYNDGSAAGTTISVMDNIGDAGAGALHTTAASTPDVIIGNWDGSSSWCSSCAVTTDFLLAAAYVNGTGDVEIDYYHVYNPGTGSGTITVTYMSNTIFSSGTYVAHNVHIDVIANFGNTLTVPGLPLCDRFIVTFDDYTTPSAPVIWAAECSSNAPSTSCISGGGTPTLISPTTGTGSSGFAPDVAAVQRRGGGIHDLALITYVDVGRNTLYYIECNFGAGGTSTSPTVSAITTLDAGGSSSSISVPRIDAYDDYSHYASTGQANYKVAAQVLNTLTPARNEVRTYDDYFSEYTSSSVVDLTAWYSTPSTYNSYAPTVACFVNQLFFVNHFLDYPSSSPNNALFMEPIFCGGSGLVGSDYFWTNGMVSGTPPPAGITQSGNYASAVACSPNGNADPIYTWAQDNGAHATHRYQVYYKFPQPYFTSFRHTPSGVATVAGKNWELYPNPASGELTVALSATGSATAYGITDMAGRELATGKITEATIAISTHTLAAGTYVLQLYKDGADAGRQLFVKE